MASVSSCSSPVPAVIYHPLFVFFLGTPKDGLLLGKEMFNGDFLYLYIKRSFAFTCNWHKSAVINNRLITLNTITTQYLPL